MGKVILSEETLNQLVFCSLEAKEPELVALVRSHHSDLVIHSRESSVLRWNIVGPIALDELCDLINEIGFNGMLISALQRIRSPELVPLDFWLYQERPSAKPAANWQPYVNNLCDTC